MWRSSLRRGGGNFGDSLSWQCSKCSLRLCFWRVLQQNVKCLRYGHEANRAPAHQGFFTSPLFVKEQLPQWLLFLVSNSKPSGKNEFKRVVWKKMRRMTLGGELMGWKPQEAQ